jgi:hypothetical protein
MNISNSKISLKDASSISINPAMKTAIKKPGKAYNDFMNSHYITGQQPITNVRIKDKKNNISGGSYHIDDDEYKGFLDMYAKEIIVKNKFYPENITIS